MGRDVDTGIVYTGEDRGATKVMKSVSSEATKTRSRLDGMKKTATAMPDAFGKAAPALALVGNATSTMGSQVADAANKVTGLVALVATGGPLGIGIAAITVAVAAGTALWARYSEATELAKRRTKELKEMMEDASDTVRNEAASLRDLIDEIDNFGKTVAEKSVKALTTEIQLHEDRAEALRTTFIQENAQLEQIRETIELRGTQNVTISRHNDLIGISTDVLKDMADQLWHNQQLADVAIDKEIQVAKQKQNRIAAIEEMAAKEVAAEQKTAAAVDRGTGARRRRAEIERQRQKEVDMLITRLEWEEAIEAQNKADIVAIHQNSAIRLVAIDRQMKRELDAARQKDLELQKAAAQESIRTADSVGAALGAVIANYIMDMRDGESAAKQFAKVIIITLVRAVRQIILAHAIEAAAKGMKDGINQAGMPYGLILGAAFAAAALGAVEAYAQHLEFGGFVRGGTRGRDSVPIRASPGEFMMSTAHVGGFLTFAKKLLGEREGMRLADAGGMLPGRGRPRQMDGGGGTTVVNQMWQPDSTGMMKMTRRQQRTVKKLRDRGMTAREAVVA